MPADPAEGLSKKPSEPATPREEERRPRWEVLLDSKVAVALVTVLLGGWIGSYITASIQEQSRRRDQEMLAYTKHLEGGLQLIEEIHEELGRMVAASENLIVITGPVWDPEQFRTETKLKQLEEQKRLLRRQYNETEASWREKQRTFAWKLNFFYSHLEGVKALWQGLQAAVAAFQHCAVEWNREHRAPTPIEDACREEAAAIDGAFESLNRTLSAGQMSGWQAP